MKKIRVLVMKRAGRTNWEAQWVDPVTGRKKTKTLADCDSKREADRRAAKLEADIQDGRFENALKTTWAEFRERYTDEILSGHAVGGQAKVKSTLNAFERIIDPKWLSAVDGGTISRFQGGLRAHGLAANTIRTHLVILQAALKWAVVAKLLARSPQFAMPKRAAGMKGRPLTPEEFERIRERASGIVGPEASSSWLWLLDGLWWSGLRLGEALALHWTDDRNLSVDLSGKRAMFVIQGHAEKGRQNRILPMAPQFANMLAQVPQDQRRGFVFNPARKGCRHSGRFTTTAMSKIITRFGAAARVKVSDRPNGEVKWASAHDFRRAFGFRWSRQVMPAILMEMMRHSSVNTTMEFYVGRNAQATAETMWAAFAASNTNSEPSGEVANTFANTDHESSEFPEEKH